MRNFCRSAALVLVVGASTLGFAQNHAFTVADDIEMRRFNDPWPGDAGKTSPDGRYVAVVTSKGFIDSNKTESTISIFHTAALRHFLQGPSRAHAPRPESIVTFVAVQSRTYLYAYAPIITDLRWSEDSQALYFVGENQESDYRLYRVTVDRKRAMAVSPPRWDVVQFSVAQQTIVFTAWHRGLDKTGLDRSAGFPLNGDAHDVTDVSLNDILFNDPSRDDTPHSIDVFEAKQVSEHYEVHRIVRVAAHDYPYLVSSLMEPISQSPQGTMLITLVPTENVPLAWRSYEPADGYEHLRLEANDPSVISPDNLGRPRQYALIDLNKHTLTPLIDAPYGFALGYADDVKVVWAPDERRVLLTNTFLSLNGVNASEQQMRLRPCAVASVELPALTVSCVRLSAPDMSSGAREGQVIDARFGSSDDRVITDISYGGHADRQEFFRRGAKWQLLDGVTTDTSGVSTSFGKHDARKLLVVVRQDLNEPPRLWVTDTSSGKGKELWNPNPQLRAMEFGQASPYRWKDDMGHEWHGGLIKPVGYVPGQRYPLVLQIYSFRDRIFLTDGQMPTAFAARHLASAGIVVLQIQKDGHTWDGEEEQHHLRGLTSAIDQLSKDGLVDSARVGIVGFSISCQYVENALIEAPRRFAAATIADGTDHSYMQYHLWDDTRRTLREQDERMIGSKAFGDGIKSWFTRAPGFHLDRVDTPLRIEAIGPWSILGEWEIYSSLHMQRKPVDLVYFPEGQHIHQTPLERMASQQGDVDWFRFWLQGYEDPDPSKANQYKLWNELKTGTSRAVGESPVSIK